MDTSDSNHEQTKPYKIKIIDAMAVLRGMKKKPSTKLFRDLSREFLAKVDYLLQSFDKGRIIFYPTYLTQAFIVQFFGDPYLSSRSSDFQNFFP